MPLTMLMQGKEAVVRNYTLPEATKKFLETLGILPGTKVMVISENNGNLIISVKGTRLALNKGVAQRLYVDVA